MTSDPAGPGRARPDERRVRPTSQPAASVGTSSRRCRLVEVFPLGSGGARRARSGRASVALADQVHDHPGAVTERRIAPASRRGRPARSPCADARRTVASSGVSAARICGARHPRAGQPHSGHDPRCRLYDGQVTASYGGRTCSDERSGRLVPVRRSYLSSSPPRCAPRSSLKGPRGCCDSDRA